MKSAIKWHAETWKLSKIMPCEWNPRQATERETKDLSKSIERFNLADPLIINTDGVLIGGHFRLKILKDKDIKEADVRVPDRMLTDDEVKELNIRLNKNTGSFDYDMLANFDEDLLKDIGFDSKELDGIFQLEPDAKDDDVPAVRRTNIKRGDLFILGKHRVLCGDATNKEDVEKLMDGKKSDMVFCDPPYNVNYGSSKNPRHKIRNLVSDNQSPEEWEEFCKKLFLIFQEYAKGDIYMWGAPGPEGMKMRLWLVELGCHWSATIIWVKQQSVLSPANYQRMYEPCFYGWFGKSSWQGDRKQTEVWEIDRPLNSKLHPTMKPVELCGIGIVNSSKRGGVVLDLFLGSGSTLIACEQTKRVCYGMEIDPQYVHVIIDRWCKFTGRSDVIKNGKKVKWEVPVEKDRSK